jgi:integrase/recombinase XerD
MRPGAINELLTVPSRRAQLPRAVHHHQLRHGFASNVTDAGGAVDEAQELLGHARAGSTRINAKPAESATQLTL